MSDLAQRIRDRLDGLAPAPLTVEFPKGWTDEQREQFKAEFKATPAAVPPVFLEPAEPPSPEEIEAWQKSWDELLPEGATVQQIRILPPGPKAYPGFEQMRDALLAVVGGHESAPAGTYLDDELPLICVECSHGRYDEVPWPCPELLVIAEKLGIGAADA